MAPDVGEGGRVQADPLFNVRCMSLEAREVSNVYCELAGHSTALTGAG
jgi:hypothetical protein